MAEGYCHRLGRLVPWLDRCEKSEQVIAVACKRAVFTVRVFLADETCFFKVLDGSTGGVFGDAEFPGNPFYAWPSLPYRVTVVIKIDVDELRPLGKLVISIQFFKVGHRFTSYTDVRTGVRRFCSGSWEVPP